MTEKSHKVVNLIQHTRDPSVRPFVEPLPRRSDRNPFKRFRRGLRICADTDSFVQDLWKEMLSEPFPAKPRRRAIWLKPIREWATTVDTARGNLVVGNLLNRVARYNMALAQYEEGLRRLRRDDDRRLHFLNRLGNVHRRLGHFDDALRCHKKVLRHSSGSTATSALEGMIALRYTGDVYIFKTQYSLAAKTLDLALSQAILLRQRMAQASIYGSKGIVLRNIGEYGTALRCHRRALAISERLGYAESIANQLGNLGLVYREMGRYKVIALS